MSVPPGHSYARLFITSEELSPETIGEKLGLRPHGTSHSEQQKDWRYLWFRQSSIPFSEPLEAHLRSLLDEFLPLTGILEELGKQVDLEILGVVKIMDGTVLSLRLDKRLVADIARLRASLGLDIYVMGPGYEPPLQNLEGTK